MDDKAVICGCYQVTVADFKNAISNGATSFEAVKASTHASTACGRCAQRAETVFTTLLDSSE